MRAASDVICDALTMSRDFFVLYDEEMRRAPGVSPGIAKCEAALVALMERDAAFEELTRQLGEAHRSIHDLITKDLTGENASQFGHYFDRTWSAIHAIRHRAVAAEARVTQLAEALTSARGDLVNAKTEASHGLTASNQFIDRCVTRALVALDAAFAPRCTYAAPDSLTGLGDRTCVSPAGHEGEHQFDIPRIVSDSAVKRCVCGVGNPGWRTDCPVHHAAGVVADGGGGQ